MISAEDFLSILEAKDLLPDDMVGKLRKQVARSRRGISANTIAEHLIKKGFLTHALAQRLLAISANDDNGEYAILEDRTESGNDEDAALQIADKATPLSTAASTQPLAVKPLGGDAVEGEAVGDKGFAVIELLFIAFQRLRAMLSARNRRRKANVWDSSLLLLGGGALAVLVILAFALIVFFLRSSSEAMIAAADGAYKDGAYTIAISQYDEFLEKFPNHQQASGARVRRGLAMIRNATETGGDYAKSLDIATQVLSEIGSEDSFSTARGELRSLLPAIAEGLCRQAHEKTSAEDVDRTRSALRLVDKYILRSQQPATRLDDIRSLLAVTEMRLARDDELSRSVAAIRAAIGQGNTALAYTARRRLLKTYPELLHNEQLDQLMQDVARAEKQAVRFVAAEKKAHSPAAHGEEMAVSLVLRSLEKNVPRAKGDVVFAVAEGAVYALRAEDGKVLWRREVGFGGGSSRPAPLPMRISPRPGSDVLLVDAKARSLLRLDAATGEVRWQQMIGEEFAARPVIDGSRVLVATRGGRLVIIDLDSGDSPGYIQLPQQLSLPPIVDNRRGQIYQVADHANLYVLSAADGSCQDVVYLGHATGTISAAPAVIAAYLVVPENRGSDNVALRVLSLAAGDEGSLKILPQQLKLEGRVDTTPLVRGTRMLVSTDVGRIYALRLSRSSVARPLEKVGQIQSGQAANLVRYLLLSGEQFWIADDHLSKFVIQVSLSNVKAEWSTFKNSVFLQPLTASGNCIFSVRRRVGLPGVVVAAIDMDRPRVFWQTHLAVAPAAAAVVDKTTNKANVVTSLGSVFDVAAADFSTAGQSVLDRPLVALPAQELLRPIDSVTYMPGGLLAVGSGRGSEQIAVYDPAAVPKKFRPLILPDSLAAPPLAFAGGLLLPCRIGQIFVLDPRLGGNLVEPFQPTLLAPASASITGGHRVDWLAPLDAGDQTVLISDGQRMIYRLGVKRQPKPHLAALDQVELDADVASPLAIAGRTAFAVDERYELRSFSLPRLLPGTPVSLDGRCVWDPCAAGGKLLLADEFDKLLCFDAAGRRKWQTDLNHGRPVGKPLVSDGTFILASREGVVWSVDAETGRELANRQTGHALAAGPVTLDGRLLLCGQDGTLYLIDQPQ